MFRGINSISLDNKGRMAMPARYRERLQKNQDPCQLVITIDTEEPCLLLYPLTEWEVIEAKINALPSFNRTTRRIQRLLIGHATELEMDSSGRILLPPLLRDYAKLTKQLMLVGQGKKFEIWDEQTWHHGRGNWLQEETQRAGEIPEELLNVSL